MDADQLAEVVAFVAHVRGLSRKNVLEKGPTLLPTDQTNKNGSEPTPNALPPITAGEGRHLASYPRGGRLSSSRLNQVYALGALSLWIQLRMQRSITLSQSY